MSKYLSLIFCLFSISALSENCLKNIWDDQSAGNIEEVKDFYDLNEDGVNENVAYVSGGPTSGLRYCVIYTKNSKGCFVQLAGGTENIGLGVIPQAFSGSSKVDVFNGYKVLQDGESIGQVMVYLYSIKSNQYVQAYTIIQSEWVRNQSP